MINPRTKRTIFRILPFGVFWLLFGLVYLLMEKGIIGELDHYPSTGNPYNFEANTPLILLIVFISGLGMGAFEILFLNQYFTKHSLGRKMFLKTSIYIISIITFLIANSMIINMVDLEIGITDPLVWTLMTNFVGNLAFWSVSLYIAAIVLVSLFYSEVTENLGPEVLKNFFIGKYHRPIIEKRVFMFLDMKSSTTHAENLGHVKYFQMLKEYYADISDPIIEFEGEIYQYVGDELVVSWKLDRGLKHNNALNCFFAMKAALAKNQSRYKNSFGFAPSFKAGFHFGDVTTGEIGVVKKDILFTGDVLNTTARIQSLCNDLNSEILISEDMFNILETKDGYVFNSTGEHQLRGKSEMKKLYEVQLSLN